MDLTFILAETAAKSSGSDFTLFFFVFLLAVFLGFELITKVPSQLHTPLMSGSNAISGITIVAAILVLRSTGEGELSTTKAILGFLALTLATVNVVGGYLVTNRMLSMFKNKSAEPKK